MYLHLLSVGRHDHWRSPWHHCRILIVRFSHVILLVFHIASNLALTPAIFIDRLCRMLTCVVNPANKLMMDWVQLHSLCNQKREKRKIKYVRFSQVLYFHKKEDAIYAWSNATLKADNLEEITTTWSISPPVRKGFSMPHFTPSWQKSWQWIHGFHCWLRFTPLWRKKQQWNHAFHPWFWVGGDNIFSASSCLLPVDCRFELTVIPFWNKKWKWQ